MMGAPTTETKSITPWLAAVSAVPCATVPFALCVLGYGSYLRAGSFLLIPFLIALGWISFRTLRAIRNAAIRRSKAGDGRISPPGPRETWATLFAFPILLGISWWTGAQARLGQAERVADRSQPLILALEKFRSDHGSYPSRLLEVADMAALDGITIRQGAVLRSAIDVAGLEEANLTVYLQPDHYLCVIPLERKLPFSISRFYVLRKDSQTPRWEKDHLIWMLSYSPRSPLHDTRSP